MERKTKPRTGEGRELAGVQADVRGGAQGSACGLGVGAAPVWEIKGSALKVIFSRGVQSMA